MLMRLAQQGVAKHAMRPIVVATGRKGGDAMATILSGSDRAHSDPAPSTGAVAQEVVGIVSEMVCDWSVNGDEPVGLDTRLVADLECGSVDIIHLVIAIEEHFNRPRMGFQELLMKDNRYVDDLTVGQIAAFVGRKLAG